MLKFYYGKLKTIRKQKYYCSLIVYLSFAVIKQNKVYLQ